MQLAPSFMLIQLQAPAMNAVSASRLINEACVHIIAYKQCVVCKPLSLGLDNVMTKCALCCVQDDIIGTPFPQVCLLVLAGCAIHVFYLALNYGLTIPLKLPLKDFKAVLIMSSQKTLPIAIAVISFLPPDKFGRHGLLTIPCIIGHLAQLFMDAFMTTKMASAEEERMEKAKELEYTDGSSAENDPQGAANGEVCLLT